MQWSQLLNIRKSQLIMISILNYSLYGTVSYLKVSTYDFLNTTNNDTSFTELTRFFEENFEMKVKGVSKFLNFQAGNH